VHERRLADDVRHAHARIQRGERVLEDHLHLEVGFPLPAIADAAARRLENAGDHAAERRLAAARFADQPHDFAFLHEERDIVDRVHDLVRHFGAERARELPGEVERLLEALGNVLELEDSHSG
jgi:hypothetical protein